MPREAKKRSPRTGTTPVRGRAARGTSKRKRDPRPKLPLTPVPIVVVTADPSLARMLSFALDQIRLPYRLITSGSRALAELLAMPVGPQAPIVVLDVDLPGMDGHAILERLDVDRPNTFLMLVLSGHADESVQVRSLLAGALDHVAKPFNVRVLMAKIQRLAAMAAHLAGAA